MLIALSRRPPFVSVRRVAPTAVEAPPGARPEQLAYEAFQESFAHAVARLERAPPVAEPSIELLSAEISGVPMIMPVFGERGGIERRFESRRSFQMRDLFLRHQLAGRGTYLDIGANVGLTCIPDAILGGFEAILAVEPEPHNFACLRYNVATNGLADRIALLHAAVGEANRTAQLKRRKKSGSHFLRKDGEAIGAGAGFVPVPVRTVDDIAAGLASPVRLIKCDTQGYEGHVLAGAEALLRDRRVPWIIELWPAAIRRAGGDLDRTLAILQSSFSRFADCRRPGPGLLPIGDLAAHVPDPDGNAFTDVLLMP